MKIETTFELDEKDLESMISDYLKDKGYKVEGSIDISINTNDKTDSGNKRSWGHFKDGLKVFCEIVENK